MLRSVGVHPRDAAPADSAIILGDDELNEHRQNTKAAEEHLRDYLTALHASDAPEIPDVAD